MSKAHLPPVPPANRNPQGDAEPGKGKLPAEVAEQNIESKNRNTEQQGRQGNTHQNTHHQGYQQDR
ncbi:MAG: hypothetical protein K2X49_19525 [Acetobacteraceae bacterium]|nr:hypothetical protein [Acetobacteraceae bacterium]